MLINLAVACGNIGLVLAGRYAYKALQSPNLNGHSRIMFWKDAKRNYQRRRADNYLLTKVNDETYAQIVDRDFNAMPLQQREVREQDDQRIKRIYNVLKQANDADFNFLAAEGVTIRFFYVENDSAQMFAFADGTIIVYKEVLARNLDGSPKYSDSMVAVMLAHEISHIILEHDLHRSSMRAFGGLCSLVAAMSVPATAVSLINPTALTVYGVVQFVVVCASFEAYLLSTRAREAEDEADDLGLRWSLNAGYDIREVFIMMVREFEKRPYSKTTQFYDSHRALLDRSHYLDTLITRVLDNSPALAQALPQPDPRIDARDLLTKVAKEPESKKT